MALLLDAPSVAGDSVDNEWDEYKNGVGAEELTPVKAKAKAKPKAEPKSSTKVRKTTTKNTAKPCRGCRKKVKPTEMAPNWPGCWSCKRALDNISKLASRQGDAQKKFVSEARQDEEKCYNMIQSYMAQCPETLDGCAGKKRGTWSLIRYVERVRAASGIVKDRLGEMMFKKLYIEHAMTIRGGRKSEEQADAQWLEWEAAVARKDPKILYDHLGENGALRIWVHTADTLRYRSEYMHEKEVECQGDQVKKATEEDVDRLRGEILTKHGSGGSMAFDSVAQALTVNGQQAFQERDGFMLDVLEFKDPEEEPADDAAGEKEDGEGEGSERPAKKPKVWVDRDRMISSTIRSCKSNQENFKNKAASTYDRICEYLKELKQSASEAFQQDFKGEITALCVRLEGLELVLNNTDENKVKQFIGSFCQPCDGEGSMKTPPCTDYAKLRPLSVLEGIIEQYNQCKTQDSMKAGQLYIFWVRRRLCLLYRVLSKRPGIGHGLASELHDAWTQSLHQ